MDVNDQEKVALEREITIHKDLIHPQIVRLYNSFVKDNHLFLILEYMENGNIFKMMREQQLSEDLVIKIFSQILSAVAFFHKQKIVHRDIKPENILWDKSFNFKLSDFGFCAPYGEQSARRTLCGTTEYMAPEVIDNQTQNDRLDIWCLGILMYELLHRKTPYQAKNAYMLLNEIRNRKIEYSKSIRRELVEIMELCLNVIPLKRPDAQWIIDHFPILNINKEIKQQFSAIQNSNTQKSNELLKKSEEGKVNFKKNNQKKPETHEFIIESDNGFEPGDFVPKNNGFFDEVKISPKSFATVSNTEPFSQTWSGFSAKTAKASFTKESENINTHFYKTDLPNSNHIKTYTVKSGSSFTQGLKSSSFQNHNEALASVNNQSKVISQPTQSFPRDAFKGSNSTEVQHTIMRNSQDNSSYNNGSNVSSKTYQNVASNYESSFQPPRNLPYQLKYVSNVKPTPTSYINIYQKSQAETQKLQTRTEYIKTENKYEKIKPLQVYDNLGVAREKEAPILYQKNYSTQKIDLQKDVYRPTRFEDFKQEGAPKSYQSETDVNIPDKRFGSQGDIYQKQRTTETVAFSEKNVRVIADIYSPKPTIINKSSQSNSVPKTVQHNSFHVSNSSNDANQITVKYRTVHSSGLKNQIPETLNQNRFYLSPYQTRKF